VVSFLGAGQSEALKPKLESELKPGTRVVMETFPVSGWKPARTTDKENKYFYLYTMPPEIAEQSAESDVGFEPLL